MNTYVLFYILSNGTGFRKDYILKNRHTYTTYDDVHTQTNTNGCSIFNNEKSHASLSVGKAQYSGSTDIAADRRPDQYLRVTRSKLSPIEPEWGGTDTTNN